ncbi:hypothetical protein G6F22_020074 [Rhizopus arrhizus]|nr:hypothetical protein G6F22_020074 [Rhizopus arrhizus]
MPQRRVPGRVAVAVVDGLEMVDVQHQHRQLAAHAAAPLQFVVQFIQDAAPGIRAGQAVERQRGLHLFRQAGLDQQQQGQEQRGHGDRSADNEEQPPG